MRVRLMVDGLVSEISTRNPRLLALWLVEQFAQVNWTEATECRALAYPTWTQPAPDGRPPQPDWLTDSRFMGQWEAVRSPEELLKALGDELARARAGQDVTDESD